VSNGREVNLPTASTPPRVAVVQDGARLHYALPVALQRAGMLHRVYTDWFIRPGFPRGFALWLLSVANSTAARRFAGRFHPEIPPRRLSTYPLVDLKTRWQRRKFANDEIFFDHHSKEVARWLLDHGLTSGQANTLMGWVRNLDPDLCHTCRAKGMLVVPDQMIAPRVVEEAEEQKQEARWPGWQDPSSSDGGACTIARERATWDAAHHLTCASDYVRDGLLGQGIPPKKVSVIPYPIDSSHYRPPARTERSGPLLVGFVGAVNLRKGAPYFLNLARRFHNHQVRFVMVGPVHLRRKIVADEGAEVEFVGRVARSEVAAWMERFDLYFFPSTCEGSATSTMEALAMGLPVVTSPNAGSVVRDGVEGFIRPYDDLDGQAEVIENLLRDQALRVELSQRARARAETFDLKYYSDSLATLLRGIFLHSATLTS